MEQEKNRQNFLPATLDFFWCLKHNVQQLQISMIQNFYMNIRRALQCTKVFINTKENSLWPKNSNSCALSKNKYILYQFFSMSEHLQITFKMSSLQEPKYGLKDQFQTLNSEKFSLCNLPGPHGKLLDFSLYVESQTFLNRRQDTAEVPGLSSLFAMNCFFQKPNKE